MLRSSREWTNNDKTRQTHGVTLAGRPREQHGDGTVAYGHRRQDWPECHRYENPRHVAPCRTGSAGELLRYTGLTTASVTSLIDRLEAGRLVRRVADKHDRRRVIVHPVPEQIASFAHVFDGIRDAFESFFGQYTETQLATILDFMTESAEGPARSPWKSRPAANPLTTLIRRGAPWTAPPASPAGPASGWR
jgi:DNA-binding MarR family transcriptional regulator